MIYIGNRNREGVSYMVKKATETYWYKNYLNKGLEQTAIQEMIESCMREKGRQQVVNNALTSFRSIKINEACPYEKEAKEVLIRVSKTKELEDTQKNVLIRFLIERCEVGYQVDYSYIFDVHPKIA